MNNVNQEQLRAIRAPIENPVIVKASAGTGKTRVLTERILFLIEEKGISAENILAITYTNLAAEEMKQRVHKALNDSFKTPTAIGTIHSLFADILRRDIDKVVGDKEQGDSRNYSFDILYEEEQIRKLQTAAKKCSFSIHENDSDVKQFLSLWKRGKFLNAEESDVDIPEKYKNTFEEYDRMLKESNKLDFDDILILSDLLLRRNPDIRDHWRNQYKCVLVDECQDLNEVQWQLIKHLLRPDGSGFFAVGDPNQCIYIFAGAKENIFEDMFDFFKNLKVEEIDLVVNYRSFNSIVNFSNTLKVIPTKNSVSYSDKEGSYQEFEDLEEALLAIRKTENYGSWAILFRQYSQSKQAIEKLINLNIPFKTSKFYLFTEPIIKRIISFLKIIYFDNSKPLDDIIQYSNLGFSEDAVKRLRNTQLVPLGTSLLEMLLNDVDRAVDEFNLSPNDGLILRNLAQEIIDLRKIPEDDIEQIITKIRKYLFSAKSLKPQKENQIDLFIKWVSNIVKSTQRPAYEIILDLKRFAEFEKEEIAQNKNNYVTLSTIHKTKGLEWDNVVILDWIELLKDSSKEDKHLPYVATTRAREKLFLVKGKSK